ncbi:MAG: lysoplasmalogenase [Pseudomonadota bacterium]
MNAVLFATAVALGPLSSILYWLGFSWRGPSAAKTWVKALPLAFLFGWLWVFAEDVGCSPIPWVVLFAWVGDIALSRPGPRAFLFGMAAFGVAHLFLIGLVVHLGIGAPRLWFALPVVIAGLGLMALLWSRAGEMRGPVVAYTMVIMAMALACSAIASGTASVDETVLLAAALFVLSDALIAVDLFVVPDRPRWRVPLALVIWPTYYVAMVLFVVAAPG